jgi:hypothetical protein
MGKKSGFFGRRQVPYSVFLLFLLDFLLFLLFSHHTAHLPETMLREPFV